MLNRLELAADVVAAHASTTTMTKDELIAEIKDYSERRKQMAIDRNLGAGLAKARAAGGHAKAAQGK